MAMDTHLQSTSNSVLVSLHRMKSSARGKVGNSIVGMSSSFRNM